MHKGQSLVEFAIFLFLIAVVCIAVLAIFGGPELLALVGVLP